ncbi:hypothetical protein GALMADRAFT_160384, partial [Galerina marginata CBS 339.88]
MSLFLPCPNSSSCRVRSSHSAQPSPSSCLRVRPNVGLVKHDPCSKSNLKLKPTFGLEERPTRRDPPQAGSRYSPPPQPLPGRGVLVVSTPLFPDGLHRRSGSLLRSEGRGAGSAAPAPAPAAVLDAWRLRPTAPGTGTDFQPGVSSSLIKLDFEHGATSPCTCPLFNTNTQDPRPTRGSDPPVRAGNQEDEDGGQEDQDQEEQEERKQDRELNEAHAVLAHNPPTPPVPPPPSRPRWCCCEPSIFSQNSTSNTGLRV